jgi:hypothetical protein
LGIYAARRGVEVVSLEHVPEWQERVNEVLKRFNLPNEVSFAPLKSYGDFEWYQLPEKLPGGFGLVVCDGPPSAGRGGRSGLMPVCKDRLTPDVVILLDDGRAERGTLDKWKNEFGCSFTVHTAGNKTFAEVRI